jgi:hypothetical protein
VLSKVEGGSAPIYVLGGSTSSDWAANVNKKVAVTGPVQQPPAGDKDSAADSKVLRPPLVVVESMKVVAPSCTYIDPSSFAPTARRRTTFVLAAIQQLVSPAK